MIETHVSDAPSAAGQGCLDAHTASADSNNDGQLQGDTQRLAAVAARDQHQVVTQSGYVAGHLSQSGRHHAADIHGGDAAGGAPDHPSHDTQMRNVGGLIISIRAAHRQRRYSMKVQQKIDRALEAYVRINYTGWRGDMDDKDREAFRKQVADIIKRARNDELDDPDLVELVKGTDASRAPYDSLRLKTEKRMEQAAKQLPVYQWIESVRGAGALGLATIVAEVAAIKQTGDFAMLSDYSSPAKVWKRLGYAPYDGHAGSTWKRQSWRPRALTAEEWIANPFSGERYALMAQIAVWLINSQWQSAKKSGGDTGKPTGHYGEVYANRRAHTASKHPDWSKGHSHSDAVRVTMKAFLKDLWSEWKTR
jgi:hypothetical protein